MLGTWNHVFTEIVAIANDIHMQRLSFWPISIHPFLERPVCVNGFYFGMHGISMFQCSNNDTVCSHVVRWLFIAHSRLPIFLWSANIYIYIFVMLVLLSIDEYFAVHIPFQQTLGNPQLSQSGSIDRAISVFFLFYIHLSFFYYMHSIRPCVSLV